MTAIATIARRALAGVTGAALLTGGALGLVTATGTGASPGLASSARIALAADAAPMGTAHVAGFCMFGHNPNGSCRGAKRARDAAAGTAQMYKDAGECALEGVGEGVAESSNEEFNPYVIAYGSVVGAAICGSEKPEGQF
jgi:hypothetical protein